MNAAQNDGRFFWLKDGGVKEDGTFELASVLMDMGGLEDADKLLKGHKGYLFFIEDKKKKSLKRIL